MSLFTSIGVFMLSRGFLIFNLITASFILSQYSCKPSRKPGDSLLRAETKGDSEAKPQNLKMLLPINLAGFEASDVEKEKSGVMADAKTDPSTNFLVFPPTKSKLPAYFVNGLTRLLTLHYAGEIDVLAVSAEAAEDSAFLDSFEGNLFNTQTSYNFQETDDVATLDLDPSTNQFQMVIGGESKEIKAIFGAIRHGKSDEPNVWTFTIDLFLPGYDSAHRIDSKVLRKAQELAFEFYSPLDGSDGEQIGFIKKGFKVSIVEQREMKIPTVVEVVDFGKGLGVKSKKLWTSIRENLEDKATLEILNIWGKSEEETTGEETPSAKSNIAKKLEAFYAKYLLHSFANKAENIREQGSISEEELQENEGNEGEVIKKTVKDSLASNLGNMKDSLEKNTQLLVDGIKGKLIRNSNEADLESETNPMLLTPDEIETAIVLIGQEFAEVAEEEKIGALANAMSFLKNRFKSPFKRAKEVVEEVTKEGVDVEVIDQRDESSKETNESVFRMTVNFGKEKGKQAVGFVGKLIATSVKYTFKAGKDAVIKQGGKVTDWLKRGLVKLRDSLLSPFKNKKKVDDQENDQAAETPAGG